LPDRHRIGLDAEDWTAFQASLEAPSRPRPRLARLLAEPGLFDSAFRH
jgi:uncharacterized protein (DUF1778 family)